MGKYPNLEPSFVNKIFIFCKNHSISTKYITNLIDDIQHLQMMGKYSKPTFGNENLDSIKTHFKFAK